MVATSEAYSSKASALGGIRAVKALAEDAVTEDQTTKEWAAGSERRAGLSEASEDAGQEGRLRKN